MEKKSLKKILLSAGLVGVIGVGASLAYFSDFTDVLTNTFTMAGEAGEKAVSLQIKENEVKYENGNYVAVPNKWVGENDGNDYENLLPGASLWKNPTVVIDPNTIDSIVVVKVTGLNQTDVFNPITIDNTKWQDITSKVKGDEGAQYFQYYQTVNNTTDLGKDLEPLFTTITVKSDLTTVPNKPEDIVVSAAAVQATNNENAVQQAVDLL